MKITHRNNELNIANLQEEVSLRGFVSKVRNLGGMIFIDLRDYSGITQLVVKPDNQFFDIASSVKNEYVIYIKGIVIERESKNKNLVTGDIEVDVNDFEVLNIAKTTPILIADETDALEETRMKYRYLDIRRKPVYDTLKLRSNTYKVIRDFFYDLDFIEVETPYLGKSTPEGARDFLIPSRLNHGEFYALPQSPQLYKQLLMIGGFEKYYQIIKCFRDENLRADRQPEFTQLDIEMSYVTQTDIMEMIEALFKKLFNEVIDYQLPSEIPVLTYDQAMNCYGSDKPDLRFEMLINDVTTLFKDSDFKVFNSAIANSGTIRCLVANKASKFSRKEIDLLEQEVKKFGAKGLAWIKFNAGEFSGGVTKFLSDEELNNLQTTLKLSDDQIILFVADKTSVVLDALGYLRGVIATKLDLIDPNIYTPVWIVDFPLFEYDEETKRYYAKHHPFTAPKQEHLALMDSNLDEVLANAYDFVINGYEVGGGSIRIHNFDIQEKMFKALGFSIEEAYEQFGFFIDALQYGTPPHGGIAFGFDRIIMLLAKTTNIRDVISFPKTQSAKCLMTQAPGTVDKIQLDELGITVKK